MKKHYLITLLMIVLITIILPLGASGVKEEVKEDDSISILVYITGVVAGSPPYQALFDGANAATNMYDNLKVKVYEAGFNQASWEEALTSLVATGEYDVVLGSNPSLPEIAARVGKKFPKQKFIITDAYLEGNDQIRTYMYNQYEQSLYLGYLAGLVTTSTMEDANDQLKIGLIAAQEYPLLSKHMIPGFLDGARMVNKDIELDFRVIGNWFDANKAAELATSMIAGGVDVFASIAGGASQGLFKVASSLGAYIVFHNTNEYKAAPGKVVGSGSMEQEKLVLEILENVVNGTVEYGIGSVVGLKDGYVGFFFDDPLYESSLPVEIRDTFESFMDSLAQGDIAYTLPTL